MKKLFIIANWKSFMTTEDASKWFEEEDNIQAFIEHVSILRSKKAPGEEPQVEKIIILCPPFTLLPGINELIIENELPFKLGAQDVSPFGEGAYTGAINAKQIREFAEYAIIGHSERRTNFGETDKMVAKKVSLALENDLIPIFCVQNENTPVPEGVTIVAYEPPAAIGSGKPDTPDNAENVAQIVKKKNKDVEFVLYGGSVNSENVVNFVEMENINGVLVGGASLDPVKFAAIVKNSSN